MQVKLGYKQTDVGVIPDDWNVTTIGDQFSIQLGKMLDAEKNYGVSRPYLGNRSVQWCRIDLSDIGTIKLTSSDIHRFRLRKGDLLVCEGGEIGRAAIWDEPIEECYYQKALHRLRPVCGYDVRLMLYVLQRYSSTRFLQNFVTQTSIAHLPKEKFATVPIPIPPTQAEQEAIADALSDAQSLIESLGQLIVKKSQLKQGAMEELLTGKKRLPGFENVAGYEQTEIGPLPKDWVLRRIGEFATIKTGPFGTLLKASEYSENGVPLISVGEIRDGFLRISDDTPRVSITVTRRLPQYVLKAGDIVFGRKGGVGRSALIRPNEDGWFLGSDGISIRPTKDCHNEYLVFQFQSARIQGWLLQNAIGTTMPSLNQDILRKLVVPVPPTRAEQECIAAVLNDMDTELTALEGELDHVRQVKQGMMQELLTGRTRLV